jgi:hypothetical protein
MVINQTGFITGQATEMSVTFMLDDAIYDEECSFVISIPPKTILFGQDSYDVEELDVTCSEPIYNRERACTLNRDS